MMMHALMDNMFNGGGLRVMVGDQMYGEPGDYVGSDRTFDRLISSLMYSIILILRKYFSVFKFNH